MFCSLLIFEGSVLIPSDIQEQLGEVNYIRGWNDGIIQDKWGTETKTPPCYTYFQAFLAGKEVGFDGLPELRYQ